MATNQIVAYSPPTVWQVPETLKSVYSHAVEVRDVKRLLLISGQFGVAPDGLLAADFASQCEQAIDNVEALLAASEMTTSNIAKLTYYVTSASNFPELVAIRQKRRARQPAPAVTAIVVSGLARPEYLIEIEAMAVSIGDIDKLDIRVGTIERVENVPKSDKLVKLTGRITETTRGGPK